MPLERSTLTVGVLAGLLVLAAVAMIAFGLPEQSLLQLRMLQLYSVPLSGALALGVVHLVSRLQTVAGATRIVLAIAAGAGLGSGALIEDNTVRSASSALTNLRVGYRLAPRTQLALDVYNLFDRKVNDIEYWYDSQLPGESAAVLDRHVHPTEPRSFRLTLTYRF